MNEINLTDLVKQISNSVQQAVQSTDFTKIKTEVKSSVHTAMEEVSHSVQETMRDVRGAVESSKNGSGAAVPKAAAPTAKAAAPKKQNELCIRPAPKGRVSGILLVVFGLLLGIPLALWFMVTGIATLYDVIPSSFFAMSCPVLLPLLFGCGVMVGYGTRLRGLAHRFRLYQQELGTAHFCSIRQLASAVGKPARFVVKDLHKMIRLKFFPGAHIDEQKTCLILDNETYELYLEAQEQRRKRQEEEERRQQLFEEDPSAAELDSMLKEGRGYIRQIKEANDMLPGEDISRKLLRLEKVSEQIFSRVEQRPDKAPGIRKFMSYYLPITLKLVNAYKEFEKQTVQGENIKTAKKEIQDTLDTINVAFENLLDSLFQKEALDVSTDISVLQTMLAQEGLTDMDFAQKKEEKPPERVG